MKNSKTNIELSRTRWIQPEVDGATGYPGDVNIKLGCLQRMADATEKMALNHERLISDRDFYKSLYEGQREESRRLRRRIAGLRGAITRLRKGAR